ncbi:MAG: DUF6340 family protein [Parabacteroides sp.]
MKYVVCGLFVGLLAGCSTISYVDIQTCNPAEITFPEQVGQVLVVNRAVAQPADRGYVYQLAGVKQDTCRVYADSALMDASRALGKALVEGEYFNDVLLYNDPLRTDAAFWDDAKMERSQIDSLCEATQVDALITVDRLLFDMEKKVDTYAEGCFGEIQVKMGGVVRAYLPGRDNPLATVYVNDSIYWSEVAGNVKMLNLLLPSPDEALRTAGTYIGQKMSPNFIPHWENETRWYFSSSGTPWKEAAAYAAVEKWDEAAARWRVLYDKGRGKTKARAASNLALSEELKGNLSQAHEWAEKSYELFLKDAGEENTYTQLLKVYVDVLADRVRKDKKLNVQFGEEKN